VSKSRTAKQLEHLDMNQSYLSLFIRQFIQDTKSFA